MSGSCHVLDRLQGLGFWVPIILLVCLLAVLVGAIVLAGPRGHVFDDQQVLEPPDGYTTIIAKIGAVTKD